MPKEKLSWESSWTPTRDPALACAIISVGGKFAEKAYSVDNVYHEEKPITDDPNQIAGGDHTYSLASHFEGVALNEYEEKQNRAARLIKTELLFPHFYDQKEPATLALQMPSILSSARTTDERRKAAGSLRGLIICYAVAYMGAFCRDNDPHTWASLGRPDNADRELTVELDNLPRRIGTEEAPPDKWCGEYERLFHPSMVAYLKAFSENWARIRGLWKEGAAAVKFRKGFRIPVVLPVGPNIREEIKSLADRGLITL